MLRYQIGKGYHKTQKDYIELDNQCFRDTIEVLNELDCEWFPVEGTLISLLRYGKRGEYLNKIDPMCKNNNYILTDSDIDIFIRIKDKTMWDELRPLIVKKLKEKGWGAYRSEHQIGSIPDMKYYINYDKNDNYWGAPHIDIHTFFVKDNYAMIAFDEKDINPYEYPFQKWNGKFLYKGGLVDDSGNYLKLKFENYYLRCPYKFMELLTKWNGGEYSNLHQPVGGTIIDSNGKHVFNDKIYHKYDKSILYKITKSLHDEGYESFYNLIKN
tara:strand:- start:2858 stop:3667 length:810 start_codon:yes stop_codon:yes gene_type:complete